MRLKLLKTLPVLLIIFIFLILFSKPFKNLITGPFAYRPNSQLAQSITANPAILLRNSYSSYRSNVQTGVIVQMGDLIAVGYSYNKNSINPTTCTDNSAGGSNTYTEIANVLGSGSGWNTSGVASHMFYAIAKANEALTVSCTSNGLDMGIHVHVVSGIATTNSIDQFITTTDATSSTTHTTASINTTNPNDYIMVYWAQEASTQTMTASDSFIKRTEKTNHVSQTFDNIVSTTGTYSHTATSTSAVKYTSIIVAFRGIPTTSGNTTSPPADTTPPAVSIASPTVNQIVGDVSNTTPVINSLSRDAGTTNGGTILLINGANFTNQTAVTFGGATATNITLINSTQLSVNTPAHASGTVDVVVSNAGQKATLVNGFEYLPAPTATYINNNFETSISPWVGERTDDPNSTADGSWNLSTDYAVSGIHSVKLHVGTGTSAYLKHNFSSPSNPTLNRWLYQHWFMLTDATSITNWGNNQTKFSLTRSKSGPTQSWLMAGSGLAFGVGQEKKFNAQMDYLNTRLGTGEGSLSDSHTGLVIQPLKWLEVQLGYYDDGSGMGHVKLWLGYDGNLKKYMDTSYAYPYLGGGDANTVVFDQLGLVYTSSGLPITIYIDDAAAANGYIESNGITITSPPPADTTPPTVSITAPTANQILPAGTTSTTLSVTTNENATCKWSTTDQAYSSMSNTFTTTSGTTHSTTISSFTNGTSYTRYVRCQDATGNSNTTSTSISFSVAAAIVSTPIVTTEGNICEANITAGKKCLYVAPNGNDSNNGSVSSPFKTFLPALKLVGPGDFIYARGGNYGSENRMVSGTRYDPNSKNVGAENCGSDGTYAAYAAGASYCTYDTTDMIAIKDFVKWATKSPAYSVANGTPGNPITIKNYPGEKPIFVMDNNRSGVVGINIEGKSWWVIHGLEIANGGIDLYRSHDIWIENNNIHHRYGAPSYNTGLIYIQRSDYPNVGNIYVRNNTLHDMYDLGCDGVLDNTTCQDQEHLSAVTTMSCEGYTQNLNCGGTKYVEIVNNTIYNMPQAFFFKNPMYGPILIENNHIYNSGHLGIMVSANVTMRKNLIENVPEGWHVGSAGVSDLIAPISGENATIEYNTFTGINNLLAIDRGFGHNIRNNVFFGFPTPTPTGPDWSSESYILQRYVYPDPVDETKSYLHRINSDNNCFITPISNFNMAKRFYNASSGIVSYNPTQTQSIFGWDKNSVFIQETNKDNIFTNPTGGDYTLKASTTAATQCANMGAYAGTVLITSSPPPPANTTPPPPTPIAGDLNLDHIVNSLDWSIMNAKWFTNDTTADINHDGIVNSIDFSILNNNWFKTW